MQYHELQRTVRELYGPALELRSVLPRAVRQRIEGVINAIAGGLLLLVVLAYAISASSLSANIPILSLFAVISYKVYGLFLIAFAARFVFSALEAFHRSYYFHGLTTILAEPLHDTRMGASWEVATLVADTDEYDITRGFLDSKYGEETLFRAGVTEEAFNKYFLTRSPLLQANTFDVEALQGVTLASYVKSIWQQDTSFQHFLTEQNILMDDVVASAEWVARMERAQRYLERWWSRDSLGRIPGIGKTWSYGETYLLEKYGHDMTADPVYAFAVQNIRVEDDEVEALEAILARARQSNALLIGEEGSGKRERVAQLYFKIREGHVLPQLEGKRIFFMDIEAMLSAKREKAQFEEEVHRVFSQAVHAGNCIIYLEHMSSALASATTIGVDLVDILSPFFESDAIQIIASTDQDSFHKYLARDARLMQYFESVTMKGADFSGVIDVLEQRAERVEKSSHISFTYPALGAIARLADRYFPDGVMPDKALDLLEELVPTAQSHGMQAIGVTDVEHMVSQKTGVPMGTPTKEERDKFLQLEEFLHKRVIGQEEAVSAVSKALRRARAGVGSADKPMGSFLFLGPTGVGKTETAKALAEALFNDAEAMIRLDMSEYQGVEAVGRMIGSAETGDPGRLPVLLRETQYGVLLLDEFEKSTRGVHDLFLQILDEGQFTDAMGKRVNARNLMIIATSNAGSDLIWNWTREGKKISEQKNVLIDGLISQGLFRPEFLNRFDDIVMFHPLGEDHILRIAEIQLKGLARRLEEKGVRLIVTSELVKAIAKVGYDPRFGGRPMRRAIKDKVEQAVADRLLDGRLKPGMELVLGPEDVT